MKTITAQLRKYKIDVKENFSIKKLTTYKIGGKVDFYITVKNGDELLKTLRVLKNNRKKYMVLGSFSNVLIREGGIKMAFIKLAGDFEEAAVIKGNMICAGAGISNAKLLKIAADNGLSGIEFLTGIPGTFGGALYMNAGAFGKGIGSCIKSIYVMDKRPSAREIENSGNVFTYRNSIFQKNGAVIMDAEIKLKKKKPALIRKEMKRIADLRKGKHPWEPSAGSVFKNNFPRYIAGKLIEDSGMKGVKLGGAVVSPKHANFIVNTGSAKFDDVIGLIKKVKDAVYKKHKIRLKEEIHIIR